MKRILKWVLPIDDQVHEIGGGRVVHVAMMPHDEYDDRFLNVWTEEEWFPESESWMTMANSRGDGTVYRKNAFKVVGTGHTFSYGGNVVGTVHDDIFVWHVVRYG